MSEIKSEIKIPAGAIIKMEGHGLAIFHGNVNLRHDDYHEDIKWEYSNGILKITGTKLTRCKIDEKFTEKDKIRVKRKQYTFDEFIDMIEDGVSNQTPSGIKIVKTYFKKRRKIWPFRRKEVKYRYIHDGGYESYNLLMKKEFWEKLEYTTSNFLIKEFVE